MAFDLQQTARDLPQAARTLVAAAKLGIRRRRDLFKPTTVAPSVSHVAPDRHVVVPIVTVFVDVADFDARAKNLGGNSYSLVAGFAARIAARLGRVRADDGEATLIIPINDRTIDDTRANAVSLATVSIDPVPVTNDLSGARDAIRAARKLARETPDEALALLPLIPFVPKRAVKRLADTAFGFNADRPVSCSNFGDIPPEIGRPDGTDAEYVILRGLDRYVTRRVLEERQGLLNVVSGRMGGKISITVGAYQPGEDNSMPHLRDLVTQTLAEFMLTGVMV